MLGDVNLNNLYPVEGLLSCSAKCIDLFSFTAARVSNKLTFTFQNDSTDRCACVNNKLSSGGLLGSSFIAFIFCL